MNIYLLFANTVDGYNYPHVYDPVVMDQIWDIHNQYNIYDLLEDTIYENSFIILDRIYLTWLTANNKVSENLKNIRNKKILVLHHYKCFSANNGKHALVHDKNLLVDQLGFEPKNIAFLTQIKADIPIVAEVFGTETKVTYFDKWLEELYRYQMKRAVIVKKNYLEKDDNIAQKKFSLFVRRYEDTRLEVMIELLSKDLLDDFHYTFAARGGHHQNFDIGNAISNYINNIPNRYISAHNKILEWVTGIPYEVEKITSNKTENYEALFTMNLGKFYNKSDIHLILETHFHNTDPMRSDFSIITEKTYKAMFYKKPFILCSQANTLQVLRDCGYKTFGHVIDESYDKIDDVSLRLNAISDELVRIRNLDAKNFQLLLDGCKETIEHNYVHLLKESKRKIPEEYNIYNFFQNW
jgi:hypothetical protein